MAERRSHELKTWPEFFSAMLRGDKPFDVRYQQAHGGDLHHSGSFVPVLLGVPGRGAVTAHTISEARERDIEVES